MFKLPKAITKEELILLIKSTKKKKYKLAWILGFYSGMRVSEIVNLKTENVNLKAKRILIEQAKGKKDRIVPLPKGFKPSMMSLIPLKCSTRTLQRQFKASLKRSGIIRENLSPHSLRHGFGTHAIESGVPLNIISELMGHSDISTTGIYLKCSEKDALESYEKYF